MSDKRVGVKATFSVRGKTVHEFASLGQEDSPAATAAAAGSQGAVEGTDKYDYRYTGTHDHGTLPALKTGGPHGEMAAALLRAKEDSDAFLTGLTNQELAQKSGDTDTRRSQSKQEEGVRARGDERQQKTPADQPEAMELESQAPPTSPPPPAAQPAKRPRP
ncbi:unnamed protein product [Scytosiphon promiscuus]